MYVKDTFARKARDVVCITVGVILLIVLSIVPTLVWGFPFSGDSERDIKQEARRSSVQILFDVPVLKVSFTEPLEEPSTISQADLDNLVKEQEKSRKQLRENFAKEIKGAIKKEREYQSRDKYLSYLKDITTHGVLPRGQNKILLGALAPEWARFPEAVLVVYRVETDRINPWEEEYEKDILAISELANVSPNAATSIVRKLETEGYTVSKEKVDEKSEAKLLWFRGGWGDSNPVELRWSVTLDGSNENLITGYDPRGIIEIRPVPEDRRVSVVAGYFDLESEFKPVPSDVEQRDRKIKALEEALEEKEKAWKEERERLQEKLDAAEETETPKRDISKATNWDVARGVVKVEVFWFRTAASGVFLGNKKVRDNMVGYQGWLMDVHYVSKEEKAFILTNAHVADIALGFEVYVSEDKEIMWIILPGGSSVRHTKDSDIDGSPSQVLAIDGRAVRSWDYDCAVMVTSKVPQYDHKVYLGDSDKVEEGDEVVMVGNPSMMQKFLTRGVIANTEYSMMKSHHIDRYLSQGDISRRSYHWLLNTNFWCDTPIGTGGTSGSGIWALSGSEKGKIIALHNAGMWGRRSELVFSNEGVELSRSLFETFSNKQSEVQSVSVDQWRNMLKGYSHSDTLFTRNTDRFLKEHPSFEVSPHAGGYELSGMNAGIKINNVKRFLQERGLDPSEFGWEKASSGYWLK